MSKYNDFFEMAVTGKGNGKINPPASEIIPLIEALRKKVVCYDRTNTGDFDGIVQCCLNIAASTRNYEDLKESDFISLKKIFSELDAMCEEAKTNLSNKKDEFAKKAKLISQLLFYNCEGMHDSPVNHSNWKDGMIFQSYENLWKVIHRLNSEWEELSGRGLTDEQIEAFSKAFHYSRSNYTEPSENSKLRLFMDMLDGKLKVIPVYKREERLVGNKIVPSNGAEYEIIDSTGKFDDNPVGLRPIM